MIQKTAEDERLSNLKATITPMRGPSGQFRKPGQNEEVEVLLTGLTENVQLLAGSTPAPRLSLEVK